MNRDDQNDDTLEQATALLRDVPLPAFPADAIAKQMRERFQPAAAPKPATTSAPNSARMRIRPFQWFTRIAASIAIFIGLLAVGWAMFRSNPVIAFSIAAERLRSVQTLSADLIVNSSGMEIHGTISYAAPGKFRVAIPGAPLEIVDMNLGKLVLLNGMDKSATVLKLDDAPSDSKRAEVDWIEKLRNVSRDAGKPLGVGTIDGVRAMKFSVMDDGQEVFVWTDAATGEPIRIEATLVAGQQVVTMALDHLTINPAIDAKLFSVTVPPGFTTESGHVSAAAISENDLVVFFKEYVSRTGSFPPSLVDFKTSLQRMATTTATRPGTGSPDASFLETVTRATRALLYINQLPPASDWHYAGALVHPGDASQPIFWHRETPSGNYKLMYGDYHSENASAAPQIAGAESPARTR